MLRRAKRPSVMVTTRSQERVIRVSWVTITLRSPASGVHVDGGLRGHGAFPDFGRPDRRGLSASRCALHTSGAGPDGLSEPEWPRMNETERAARDHSLAVLAEANRALPV